MEVTFVIPSRVAGKGRARATIIRSNKERDEARASALASIKDTIDWRAVWSAAWEAGWKAACNIGFISEYTPKETKLEELRVKSFGKAAMCGRAPIDGPVWLSVEVQQIPPPSWPKRKREETRYITGKPDGDNQLKLILDALNGVCWSDDSRIAAFAVGRFYEIDGPEQVTVRFGLLDAARMPVPDWAPKTLPLFEGLQA